MKGLRQPLIVPCMRRLHDPRCIGEFRKIDLAAARPFALWPRGDHQLILEQEIDLHIVGLLIGLQYTAARQDKVVLALAEFGKLASRSRGSPLLELPD